MSANLLFSSRHLVSRRAALAGLGLATGSLALGAAALPALAQRRDGPAEVPMDELLKSGAGDLPELAMGPAEAKVTVVEFASMTCGHCARFAKEVFPELKKKYIDTNQVRFIFRDFPLDNLAAAVSMLGRCAGGDKAFPLLETFFHTQPEWAFKQGNPVPRLFEVAKQAGFTQETFDKCLTDQKLLESITAGRTRAAEKFGVQATPTFFINGKRFTATPTLAEFDKVIEPLLKG